MGSSNSKGRKKSKPMEPVLQDYILSVESGPYLNLDQRRRSHVSISSEHLLVGPNKGKLAFSQGTDDSLRRKSESSLMDLTNSVEALTRCIETINMQKAANRKIEQENHERRIQMEERQRLSECSKMADETLKIGDFGRSPKRNFPLVQQVTTPAKLKLNQQGSATASCRSSVSNKSENSKNNSNNNRNMSNANGDGDYIQPNFGNVRTSSVPRSRPSQLGPFLVDSSKDENGKQRSPPPIDSVTMIYRKSNEKPSIASIQVQHLDGVELDRPDAVAQLIESKADPPKPPGLGLRTAIKIEEENVEGRQHGNVTGRSGTQHSRDSESAPTSMNTGMGSRLHQDHFDKRQPWSNAAPDETEQPTRKLKIRGLRNFVEKRRPGPNLWARQFPCRSKFHPDSYLYEFEGPTAPKRPVEAMNACRKKCGRCRACGVFSDNVCPQCGNCPFDCKCPQNGFATEQDQPGPEYFLSQILGSKWSQKQKIQVNNNGNNEDDPQPIYPRFRNLNNLTSSNNPLKISSEADSKPINGDPPAPPVIATGYNTYAPASPGMVAPGAPFYPGYGYPYFTPGPPSPVMPMMYPPGMVPLAPPMAPPPFYAPYPAGYPTAPGGVPPPYAPGPVY